MCGVKCPLCSQKICSAQQLNVAGCHLFPAHRKPEHCWDYMLTCKAACDLFGAHGVALCFNGRCESFRRAVK